MAKNRAEQIKTCSVSIESVMRTKAFRQGVASYRAGKKPAFDKYAAGDPDSNDDWFYEKGRQFAVLAPRDLQIVLENRLNPGAVQFFWRHFEDIC